MRRLPVLEFEGWAQCRLATDPDPADEPRGVSGWTFAVAGEPDLDRILRFQPERAVPRSYGPSIGVTVRGVSVGGTTTQDHPLVGARVDLLGDPVFDGRNGLASEDGQEPILPFHLSVEGSGIALSRTHTDPVSGEWLSTFPTFGELDPALAAALGVAPPDGPRQYRDRRAAELRQALAGADEVERVALAKRLDAFQPGRAGIGVSSLQFWIEYRIPLGGAEPHVDDPAGVLGGRVSDMPWVVDLGVGVWDADALCAYVKGSVRVPLAPG